MKRVIFLIFISFFLLSSVASGTNQILNPSIEIGNVGSLPTDWLTVSGYSAIPISTSYFHDGSRSAGRSTSNTADGMRQIINLTNVDNITFYTKVVSSSDGGYLRYDLDESILYSSSAVHDWTLRTIDVSGYSGNHTLLFIAQSFPSKSINYYIDNFTADDGIPPEPQITTIQTRITKETFPLTGIIINDVNSTGGFPNEQGYVTLTPTNNSEKIYPITLTGNDLIDGFELQITATGSEVTATPITVNNLGSDRTYNIYLDDQFLEKIGEVTTYQYNMTSFSTHTLKVEYDISEEDAGGGGGSGPITPPDEELIEIGELVLTKDEFDLLTIEQVEALNVSQDTKDKLIAIKSINVNWWLFILVISLTGLIVESSHKKGHESIIIISFVGVIISAYKLGYF